MQNSAHFSFPKRGLFNAIGLLSKSLYGTATEADVRHIANGLRVLTYVVSQSAWSSVCGCTHVYPSSESLGQPVEFFNFLDEWDPR